MSVSENPFMGTTRSADFEDIEAPKTVKKARALIMPLQKTLDYYITNKELIEGEEYLNQMRDRKVCLLLCDGQDLVETFAKIIFL